MIQTEIYLYKDDPKRNWRGAGDFGGKAKWFSVVQGECGSEKLQFHLMQDSEKPLDLTGKTITFYFTKADGNRIFLEADAPAETAAQGIASVVLTAQATAAYGFAKHGEIRVTESDGSVLKFQTPDIFVNYSDSEEAIESTPEFHALDIALNKTDEAISFCKSIVAGISQTIAEQIDAQKGAASGIAALDSQKMLVQMPTAADVGASNPNLLLNGDFSVWQRGTSFSVTDTSKYFYTADRWRVKSTTVITKGAGGLKTSAACVLEQPLENADFQKICGKTVTLSYSVNGTVSSKTFAASSTVVFVSLAAGDVLNWAKLELGKTATALSPRPYAEELNLCQRFYETQKSILLCVVSPIGSFDQTFPYRTKKRIPAAIRIFSPNGTPDKIGYYSNNWIDQALSSLPLDSGSGDNLRVVAQGTGYFQFGFTADAEIYD